jgi:hypothetical protein
MRPTKPIGLPGRYMEFLLFPKEYDVFIITMKSIIQHEAYILKKEEGEEEEEKVRSAPRGNMFHVKAVSYKSCIF